MDLPNCGTPYSLWTCPTVENLTHCGPAPPLNTLLTLDLLNRGTPYSLWACPPLNTLLNMDLPHRGTPYSQWTCTTAEHPTHLRPAPCVILYSMEEDLKQICKTLGLIDWIGLGANSVETVSLLFKYPELIFLILWPKNYNNKKPLVHTIQSAGPKYSWRQYVPV